MNDDAQAYCARVELLEVLVSCCFVGGDDVSDIAF